MKVSQMEQMKKKNQETVQLQKDQQHYAECQKLQLKKKTCQMEQLKEGTQSQLQQQDKSNEDQHHKQGDLPGSTGDGQGDDAMLEDTLDGGWNGDGDDGGSKDPGRLYVYYTILQLVRIKILVDEHHCNSSFHVNAHEMQTA